MPRDLEEIRTSVAALLSPQGDNESTGDSQRRLALAYDELRAYQGALDALYSARESARPAALAAIPDATSLTIFDAVPVACGLVNTEGALTLVNAAFSQLFDEPTSALLGSSLFSRIAGSGRELLSRTLEAARQASKIVTSCDLQFYAGGGGNFVELDVVVSLWSGDGVTPGTCLVVLHDLTRHRREERERRRSLRELNVAQMQGAIGFLLGNLSQSMNAVLGNISRVASLVLLSDTGRESVTPDMREILYACEEGRTKLTAMTRHTTLSRAERREINLNDLIPGVVKLVRHIATPLVRIEVAVGTGQLCSDVVVSQVVLAVTNLCFNAVESFGVGGNEPIRPVDPTERGEPVVSVLVSEARLEPTDARKLGVDTGNYVKITVQDNGHGMSAEVKAQATEPFFSTKPPESGVGLGLTLVAACARNHRGAVELESEATGGTTVSLYLPLRVSASGRDLETLIAPERRLAPATRAPRTPEAAPANERVALFVDDEPLMQETGRRLLDKLGFKVDIASDGVEAFEAYSRNPERYALMVLDVSLPRMSGVEVLERVLERQPEMKVLLITGHPTLPVTPAVLAKPNVYVLQKPFSIQEVKLAIERLLHPK